MRCILGTCFFLLSYIPLGALADSQCGEYLIHWSDDGLARINGYKPETQKITFLKNDGDYDNVKFEWVLATDFPGKWMGMEFIGRNGKAVLNTQWLQANMNNPKIIGSYSCSQVKDK